MTPTLAVTSGDIPHMPAILFAAFLLILTLRYAAPCWLKPFTHCHRCQGTGHSPRRLSDRIRYGKTPRSRAARGLPDCPHCRATGLRLRLGRRVYNHASRLRRQANP